MEMATNPNFDLEREKDIFNLTFTYLCHSLDARAFKRWNGHSFGGKFLMSVFEVLATGVSRNVDALSTMSVPEGIISLKRPHKTSGAIQRSLRTLERE